MLTQAYCLNTQPILLYKTCNIGKPSTPLDDGS